MKRLILLLLAAMVPLAAGSALAEGETNLPPGAALVVLDIASSARARDFKAIRAKMVDDFTWSFGGDRDADQAIQEWQRDPRYLEALERILRTGCRLTAPERVECIGRKTVGFRAAFAKTPKGWRMESFVEGD
jgi:hypothetical protein